MTDRPSGVEETEFVDGGVYHMECSYPSFGTGIRHCELFELCGVLYEACVSLLRLASVPTL